MRTFLLACLLLLSACASVPASRMPAVDAAARSAFLASHPDWRMHGRVAYSHQGKGGSARIDWKQDAKQAEIRLSTPLALSAFSVRLTADWAQIRAADGKLLAEGAPGDIFMQVLNSPVPDSGFSAGLRAFWPDAPQLTESALAGDVVVDGWHWRYLEWHESPVRLPKHIELTRAETRLRILIDDWQELAGE